MHEQETPVMRSIDLRASLFNKGFSFRWNRAVRGIKDKLTTTRVAL